MFIPDHITGKTRGQVGYDGDKMRQDRVKADRRPARSGERGNIILISALIVLALGGAGIGLARMVQARNQFAADIQRSNYFTTLVQNVAESGVNNLLYNWNTGQSIPPAIGSTFSFPIISTTYQNFSLSSTNSYTVIVAPLSLGSYSATVSAAVTTLGTVPALPTRTRRVVVTIASTSLGYAVSSYNLLGN